MAEDQKIIAYTKNVILLQQGDKLIGFMADGKTFGCDELSSDDAARLIDPSFGVISRSTRRSGEG